jgi:hypothetical protein
MDWRGGLSRRRFRVRDRILAPHIAIGSVSGSAVAGVLGNKFVTRWLCVYFHHLHTPLGVS